MGVLFIATGAVHLISVEGISNIRFFLTVAFGAYRRRLDSVLIKRIIAQSF